jgi:hypothetical protein
VKINGKQVIDATKSIWITISPMDCRRGQTKDPGACAAARAAVREVPNCIHARIHVGRVYIEKDECWIRYLTSQSLRTEIVSFDRGAKFYPGKHRLIPPTGDSKLRLRRKPEKRGARKPRPNHLRRPRPIHVAEGVRKYGANR